MSECREAAHHQLSQQWQETSEERQERQEGFALPFCPLAHNEPLERQKEERRRDGHHQRQLPAVFSHPSRSFPPLWTNPSAHKHKGGPPSASYWAQMGYEPTPQVKEEFPQVFATLIVYPRRVGEGVFISSVPGWPGSSPSKAPTQWPEGQPVEKPTGRPRRWSVFPQRHRSPHWFALWHTGMTPRNSEVKTTKAHVGILHVTLKACLNFSVFLWSDQIVLPTSEGFSESISPEVTGSLTFRLSHFTKKLLQMKQSFCS